MLTPMQNWWFLSNNRSYLLCMTLVQEVDIVEAAELFCYRHIFGPLFLSQNCSSRKQTGIFGCSLIQLNKRPILPPSSQLQWANIRSKREFVTLPGCCRAGTAPAILEMQQSCLVLNLPRAIHRDLVRNLELCFMATALSIGYLGTTGCWNTCRDCVLLPPLLTDPAIHCDKWGVSHSLPFSTASQSTETRSKWAFGSMRISPFVSVASADLFAHLLSSN